LKAMEDENPDKAALKRKILDLWKTHGKLNEIIVKKEIGHRKLRKYFGGMMAIYDELGISKPKQLGKFSSHSDNALLDSLREAFHKHGKLSKGIIIKECIAQPSTYIKRFDSLPNAYNRVGYRKEKNHGKIGTDTSRTRRTFWTP
ncbi:MAG: hypothetical protein AAB309_05730, partial [Deltaproteobacteria bacterium]